MSVAGGSLTARRSGSTLVDCRCAAVVRLSLPNTPSSSAVKFGYCGFVFLISSRSRLIETSSATATPPDSITSFQVIPNLLRLI